MARVATRQIASGRRGATKGAARSREGGTAGAGRRSRAQRIRSASTMAASPFHFTAKGKAAALGSFTNNVLPMTDRGVSPSKRTSANTKTGRLQRIFKTMACCGIAPCDAHSTRRKAPRSGRHLGDGLAFGGNLNVLHPRPAIGEGAVRGREGIAGLTGGLDVERMLKVREVVDCPISRGTTVGERWIIRKVHDAAIERIGIAGAWHLDVEERSDAGDKPERTMLAKSEVHRAPTPLRWVLPVTVRKLSQRRSERAGDEDIARLMPWRRVVVA